MSQLEIYTLGGVRFLEDGESVDDLSTRKVEALAIYLASCKRPQPREALADLFWDDRSQNRAMSNLRVALSNLRKRLGSYFIITRNDASLDPKADVWFDTAELETFLTTEQSKIEQIEANIELYQGEFLQGFSVSEARLFEEWVSVERERLHHLVLDGLSQVVEAYLTGGDYAAGIQQATRWLQLDPLSEAAHRGMMRLMAYNSQAGAAIRQYQECIRLLDQELGLMPSPETAELYEAIQAGTLVPPERPELVLVVPEKGLSPETGEPPYKGLSFYDVDDAHLFFGREGLTARLVALLKQNSFLAVVGASGSGKSSLVRAGLLPALCSGEPFSDGSQPPIGSEMWPVHLITPTARPLKALALSLTRTAESTRATTTLMDDLARETRSLDICAEKLLADSPANRLLLVVDQFEELFTLCRDELERQAFVDNLLTAVTENPGGAVTIVITLRADFYAHCAHYDGLRELLQNHQVYIGQMSYEELRQAIEGPATSGGWTFEPGLVDLMLHDVGASRNRKPEPGALPLLSHALQETWLRRRGREMTFSSYVETSGVKQAIAKTAETVYNEELTVEQQQIARSIFIRLTELGEGTQITRRRATLAEFIPKHKEAGEVEAVLQKLAAARLITTWEDGGEVAHEALIREWPRLNEWLAEDKEGLRLHRQLTEAALSWQLLDKDEGALYRGARLAQVGEWVEEKSRELNILEREFLEASLAHARREEAEQEAQRQRELVAAQELAAAERRRAEEQTLATKQLVRGHRRLLGALVAASLLAIAAIFFGFSFRQNLVEAERRNRITHARELAGISSAVLELEPELSLLLAIEAVNTTLHKDGFSTPEAERALLGALGLRPQYAFRGHSGIILQAVFSPDGKYILTAGMDGTARLWEPSRRSQITLAGIERIVRSAVFSPDGTRIITASDDGSARIWDGEGNLINILEGHDGVVWSAKYNPAGNRIVTTSDDGTAIFWDADGTLLATLRGHLGPVQFAVFNQDGTRIVTAGFDGTPRVWDVSAIDTGTEDALVAVLIGHVGRIESVAFSPDGRYIVTGGTDGKAMLWSVEGDLLASLAGQTGQVHSVGFSPDGTRILTASEDNTARLWDISGAGENSSIGTDTTGNIIEILAGHTGEVHWAGFSPDGRHIATISQDGTALLWNAEGNLLAVFNRHNKPITVASFSPDGSQLVTADENGLILVWEIWASIEAMLAEAETRVSRVFTVAECRLYLHLEQCPQEEGEK